MENVQNNEQALGYFGFTKKVVHRGKGQEVNTPNVIDAEGLALSTEVQKSTMT